MNQKQKKIIVVLIIIGIIMYVVYYVHNHGFSVPMPKIPKFGKKQQTNTTVEVDKKQFIQKNTYLNKDLKKILDQMGEYGKKFCPLLSDSQASQFLAEDIEKFNQLKIDIGQLESKMEDALSNHRANWRTLDVWEEKELESKK